MAMIKTDRLCKNFKDKKAVRDLSISIEKNEIYAFLGLNGAGKTTAIKMLNGLIRPTSGDAVIDGHRLSADLDKIKAVSSVSPQETALSGKLTVCENIFMMARLYGIGTVAAKQKTEQLISSFKLEQYRNKPAAKLSGGYQRRLSIAMALVSDPKILYLDEPTLGLDVIARRELWQLIKSLREKMTVVLTTHYLEEVEALSDRIGIIKDGMLLFEGTSEQLYERAGVADIEEAFIKISGGDGQ
ncbi:MAG: ABC transporter ATP-binding protein [Firmicutes bacterium]|nr:ABC transporter ATP-binding protein [Bacillota bacterium]